MSDWHTFVQWELASRETIDFKMIYVDIAGGDILAGLLLSQIVYWNLPGKDGRSKLRVQKEDKLWLARKHSDWYQEIRMSEDQVRRALKVLQALQLVEVKLFKFDGAPTNHICLNRNGLAHAIKNQSVLGCSPDPFGPEPNSIWEQTQIHLGQNPIPLTETTYKDYNKDLNTPFNPPTGETSEIKQISLLPVLVEPKTVVKKPRSKKERQFSDEGIPLPKHDPDGFLRWIKSHPKQSHFASAANEWDALKPRPAMVEQLILNSTDRTHKDADWVKEGGKYIPNPAAFLKGCRWLDKYTEVSALTAQAAKPQRYLSQHEQNQEVLKNYLAKKGIKTHGLN